MCVTIFFRHKQLESQREAKDLFGRDLIFRKMFDGEIVKYDPESCLCHVDVETMAKETGYSWKYDPSFPAYILIPPQATA